MQKYLYIYILASPTSFSSEIYHTFDTLTCIVSPHHMKTVKFNQFLCNFKLCHKGWSMAHYTYSLLVAHWNINIK